MKAAYNAYQTHVLRNGPDVLLPGLNYTQQQLFWISSAQVWCSVVRPEYLSTMIATDHHIPNEFRVIGVLSNNRDFAKDFSCEAGSNMNPIEKCEVW